MAASFKVLIAGAGPVGLTTALALSRANISFTLLEKYHTVVPEVGSDLVISPVGLRALSQLGLFDALDAVATPLGPIQRIDHDGKDLGRMIFFRVFKEQFGQAHRVLRRYDLCKILYDALPDSENILCNKEITKIQETEQGVEASCADGTTYKASMIIGADGVHSIVRRQIASNNNKTPLVGSANAPCDIDDVFKAQHRCLWMSFSVLPGLPIGGTFETHGPGASTQMFISDSRAVCGIYERLTVPIDKRVQFAREDEEEMVRRWGSLPLIPDGSVTVSTAYAHKVSSGLTAVQEGVRERWSSPGGRMVLVGDAAHVFSPIIGAGCNNGIIGVVALSNELRSLLDATTEPSVQQLRNAFACYQAAREEYVKVECQLGMSLTETASWANLVHRLVDTYIVSMEWVQLILMKYSVARLAKTPSFTFLPVDEHVVGKMPWQAGV